MDRKLAITGGVGFIGSNLAEVLAKENQVVVIDDLSSGKAENLAGIETKFVRGRILDPDLLKSAFQGVDCVFHEGCYCLGPEKRSRPGADQQGWDRGTLNVLVATRDAGVKRWYLRPRLQSTAIRLSCPSKMTCALTPSRPTLSRSWQASVTAESWGTIRAGNGILEVFQRLRTKAGSVVRVFWGYIPVHLRRRRADQRLCARQRRCAGQHPGEPLSLWRL